MAYGEVNETAKGCRRAVQAFGVMGSVKIENNAGIRLLRPGEKAFVVLFGETDVAINQARRNLASKFQRCFLEEIWKRVTGHIKFADHLGSWLDRMHLKIDIAVIILKVITHILCFRSVNSPGSSEI